MNGLRDYIRPIVPCYEAHALGENRIGGRHTFSWQLDIVQRRKGWCQNGGRGCTARLCGGGEGVLISIS